ncbi:MAG: hypothetical protein CFE21_04415 [Bacteroidetes bacterium B1(2017)]|nr:MAG: hypothetical protein CFE21_04415 [Bacteroidetes bacterium B1(2017)]
MKKLLFILCVSALPCLAQKADTLQGYQSKVVGEEIMYFSPLHQFAPKAMLTRTLGKMPVSWLAPTYSGKKDRVCYEVLIGHSTGTSSGARLFDITLNGERLFTLTTQMKELGNYRYVGQNTQGSGFEFVQQEYDLNKDGFGKLFITVPSKLVKEKAVFSIEGQNQNSRDWLMVFMYAKKLQVDIQATNLVLREDQKRQVNILLDNPYKGSSSFQVLIGGIHHQFVVKEGYNKLSVAAYNPVTTGVDKVVCVLNRTDTVYASIELKPIHNYVFNIIHHSHNDIGYSHLQTEVEQIQNRNIRSAIKWIAVNKYAREQPYWHIESLWAVENFLRVASESEKEQFITYVKSGNIVLSANYANILTGLAQPKELDWALEYAKKLQATNGIKISNVMTTDIPGLSYSGFNSYVNNGIPYLSFGPNYVGSLADKGDRVGSVIEQQGDKAFYWKPDSASTKRLLVWTAGKGYSYFHGIPDATKQETWEQRISDYCQELLASNYPYEDVQLRYTKISDNGPVDTLLCDFVKQWNKQFLVPQLHIASLNTLYQKFETEHQSQLPTYTGEISPYWEDGAYSTAKEEMAMRSLVQKTLALEEACKSSKAKLKYENEFYLVHKNVVLFHEHTWGSWCSISDPEIAFTTEQWRIKKAFLDSAEFYYNKISKGLGIVYKEPASSAVASNQIEKMEIDPSHGGLKTLLVKGNNIISDNLEYGLFEPIYMLGINPSKTNRLSAISIEPIRNNELVEEILVKGSLPSLTNLSIYYILYKKEGRIVCRYSFDKQIEKNKESMHIALPFALGNKSIYYGNKTHWLSYPETQLAGSNKEFICVEDKVKLIGKGLNLSISCPQVALYEVGGIINEDKTNGSKVWSRENQNTSTLFLYVFNNYWHTNYKAYQEGHFEFDIELKLEP